MQAKIQPISSELILLKNILPLKQPLSLTISIGNTCDFKCVYCGQHLKKTDKQKLMDLEEFQLIINQLKEFKEPLKQIAFVSSGETLLNKCLPKMIKQIKDEKVAENVKIITNGSHLTPEYSDALISAGLDNIKISIQGLSRETYQQICGVNLDYDKFFNQLKYLYDNRKQCKVHIKIIDMALKKEEHEKFFEKFKNIADYIFIEHCCEEGILADNKYFCNTKGTQICPMPFYTLFIDEWLDVLPCCLVNRDMVKSNQILGNLNQKTITKMWEFEFAKLWVELLTHEVNKDSICSNCIRFKGFIREEDIIDDKADCILKKIF